MDNNFYVSAIKNAKKNMYLQHPHQDTINIFKYLHSYLWPVHENIRGGKILH